MLKHIGIKDLESEKYLVSTSLFFKKCDCLKHVLKYSHSSKSNLVTAM